MKYIYILMLSFSSFSLLAEEISASVGWAGSRQLGLPLSGVVKEITSQPGSYVRAGDSLLSLDCDAYNAQYKQKKAIAEGLKPAVERTKKDKELADELFERTVLSEVELRNAELIYIETRAKYDAANAEANEKKWNVKNCKLKADSDLIILDVHVAVGEVINPESTKPVLVTVASRIKMMANATVSLPLNKTYMPGKELKVEVSGHLYDGEIVSVRYASDGSAVLNAEFAGFDPQLISNKSAKLIIK